MENMTPQQEDIMYLRMALALSGISADDFNTELIINIWDEVKEKRGKFNIEDAVRIKWDLIRKYQKKITVEAVPEKNTTTNE